MLHAMVLAGGRSSRMGRDKVLLEVEGRTLLERALSLLQETGAENILISGEVEGYRTVPDLWPHQGPPGGLHAALRHIGDSQGLDGSPLLVIPVDMPLLTPAPLRALVEGLGEAQAARYEGEVFPCVFRATPALQARLEALFAPPEAGGAARSMKGLLAWAEARVLSPAAFPEGIFMNVNRPEEWQAFLSGLRAGPGEGARAQP